MGGGGGGSRAFLSPPENRVGQQNLLGEDIQSKNQRKQATKNVHSVHMNSILLHHNERESPSYVFCSKSTPYLLEVDAIAIFQVRFSALREEFQDLGGEQGWGNDRKVGQKRALRANTSP